MAAENPATGTLYIIAAPSGAGKTSLVKALLTGLEQVEVSVSYTTRPPRPGEQDGVDYHFISATEFRQLIATGALLEYAKVLKYDYYYGTGRDRVLSRLAAGSDVILEIDWQGAQQVREQFSDCCGVFILPPSRAALEQRLRARGQDSDAVIARRMTAAVDEMSHFNEFDYLLINDDFEQTLAALRAIFIANRQRCRVQTAKQQNLLHQLLS